MTSYPSSRMRATVLWARASTRSRSAKARSGPPENQGEAADHAPRRHGEPDLLGGVRGEVGDGPDSYADKGDETEQSNCL